MLLARSFVTSSSHCQAERPSDHHHNVIFRVDNLKLAEDSSQRELRGHGIVNLNPTVDRANLSGCRCISGMKLAANGSCVEFGHGKEAQAGCPASSCPCLPY